MTDANPREAPPEPPARDLIGWEFWAGKVLLVILSALLAVWLAVRAGSADAARFQQYQDVQRARTTLRVIRTELEQNVSNLKAAHAALQDKKAWVPDLEASTLNLRIGASKSYAALLDAALLGEIERLFAWPLPDLDAFMRKFPGGLPADMRPQYAAEITKIIDHAEKVVIPTIEKQDQALAAAEARLKGDK